MILVDTSVWVDHFRGTVNPQTNALEGLIRSNRNVCVCGIVLTEVLAGLGSDRRAEEMLGYFERITSLSIDQKDYILAAELYRSARKSGHTVRRVMDCLIAACAITHSAQLLHRDRDFDTLARVSKLKIFLHVKP